MKRVCQKCGSIHAKNERCGKTIDPRVRSIKVNNDYRNEWSGFISSKPWSRKRSHILRRDNGVCICCKNKYNRVTSANQVHHIDKIDHYNKLDDHNLISLCYTCHKRIDKDPSYYDCKSYIDQILEDDDGFILG